MPKTWVGIKPKDLIGIPWMLAFALRADGWYLRSDIIWDKPNAMPRSVKDRPSDSHEHIFLLSKSRNYYFDYKAIQEPATSPVKKGHPVGGRKRKDAPIQEGNPMFKANTDRGYEYNVLRNKRSVWRVSTRPFSDAHFAVFPEELIVPCVLAGCPEGGVVLDPFNGSGTTRIVATKLGRHGIGFEINPEYIEIENRRRDREFKQKH